MKVRVVSALDFENDLCFEVQRRTWWGGWKRVKRFHAFQSEPAIMSARLRAVEHAKRLNDVAKTIWMGA